ncbi:plant UBX domain-containing protein 7-like [Humulus lupulus]|uniref:plant UBX domain-containing protein 7-like n=1 Tax=Humulus lupulus TaxID=3486 RepID=UPI002B405DEE|nr:plant UBX domain-containing protein 7-like [Humulus lupulus]
MATELGKLRAELEEQQKENTQLRETNKKLEEDKASTFEIMEDGKTRLLAEYKEKKEQAVDSTMYRIIGLLEIIYGILLGEQATSWKLEEAIQLFYIGSEGGTVVGGSSSQFPPTENIEALAEQTARMIRLSEAERNLAPIVGDEVRPPLPVIREALYDDALMYGASRMRNPSSESNSLIAFHNFDEEMKRPGVWESEQGVASTADNARDNLASLYRPPFHIMFQGSFEKAKGTSSSQDKWLLVNLQSTKEFSSHMVGSVFHWTFLN